MYPTTIKKYLALQACTCTHTAAACNNKHTINSPITIKTKMHKMLDMHKQHNSQNAECYINISALLQFTNAFNLAPKCQNGSHTSFSWKINKYMNFISNSF